MEHCQIGNEGVLIVYLIPATYCVNKYGRQPERFDHDRVLEGGQGQTATELLLNWHRHRQNLEIKLLQISLWNSDDLLCK